MADRQILFTASMVRALLDARKTETRRIVKPQPEADASLAFLIPQPNAKGSCAHFAHIDERGVHSKELTVHCPYGMPGDRLRVRETAWERPERTRKMMREGADTWPPYIYDADYGFAGIPESEKEQLKAWGWKRRPSIHLPRLGSRIILEITGIRIERLQDISVVDALAEGVITWRESWDSKTAAAMIPRGMQARDEMSVDDIAPVLYRLLWEQINGHGSWAINPWVWVIKFRRVAT